MKKISAHKSWHNLSDDDNHEIFEQLTVIIANVDFLFHKEFDIQKEDQIKLKQYLAKMK